MYTYCIESEGRLTDTNDLNEALSWVNRNYNGLLFHGREMVAFHNHLGKVQATAKSPVWAKNAVADFHKP